ncbi:hypothetical protein [Brevundimonas sp.]|uniref:hypothetical protein n=1 Tax=Brevundimonas sp. TaxID=1871086 RepID=UPI0035683EDB
MAVTILLIVSNSFWLIASVALAVWFSSVLWRLFSDGDLDPIVRSPEQRRLKRSMKVWLAGLLIPVLIGIFVFGAYDRAVALLTIYRSQL